MLQKLKINVLDLFFPPRCVGCGVLGSLFCDECKINILFISEQTCPRCNKISPKGKFCNRCRPKVALSGIASSAYFREGNIKEAMHGFKYEGVSALGHDLSGFLTSIIGREKIKFDVIMFVPITKKRYSWRGYNQAEILARGISAYFQKPIVPGLLKAKETKTQVGLQKKEREKNISGAFKFKGKKPQIKDKRILLVDDVVTTGTTLNECAKVLKSAGAREVWAITVAKE